MTVPGILGTVAQVLVIAVGSPFLVGLMRQVRARLEGRSGAGIGQPWRDLRKLLRKEAITPEGTGVMFRAAPFVLAATTLVVAATVPFTTTGSVWDGVGDLFVVAGLLALGTVALALAGLDTGTAFGGMGASREMTIMALVEPTIMLSVFALAVPAGSTNLAAIVDTHLSRPGDVVSPAGLLAAAALLVVAVAETGRVPVDNPSTHLELTMVHEAMILEYAGPDLAVIEWAGGMRLSILLGLVVSLFAPWGITLALPLAIVVFAGKVAVLAAGVAAAEVFMAKLRMFRVPELLAGSFLLALLATSASFFLG